MRKDLIAGNWKMNATHLDAIQMVQKLSYRLDPADHDRVDVVVCPPFTALRSAQTVIESDNLAIALGAQHCHWESSGAFTGEIAPEMLRKLSVTYVIAGHSERRQHFGETDEMVNRRVKAILAADMTPIMCVGETLEQREEGVAESWVRGQVEAGLAGFDESQIARVVVAYEPIWAIGTGQTASADDAEAMCALVRATIAGRWGATAEAVRVLYGGSVNPGNIAGLMAKKNIDGGLVGGASLDPDSFASVIRYWI